MKYLSLFSGIEAASVAWNPLGWEAVAFSEIEPFPCAVLAHHYPNVPNYGDVTKYKEWPDANIDVLVGGSPCQAFSVAGLRKGLDDPRGNLTLTYLAVVERYRPKWVVWENVPGVLSVDGGRVFGAFLGGLEKLGYGFAYRVLDAQYFGVAQRRRRVFVVGCLGDWRSAAAVLFEREGLRGDSAPSREKECNAYAELPERTDGTGAWPAKIACTLYAKFGSKRGLENQHALGGASLFVGEKKIRMTTPVEWERLQGFPDGYTAIPVRGKEASDGPRYKALGNSMAVPCMRWIGERIAMAYQIKERK